MAREALTAPKIAIKTKGRVIFVTPGELISAKAEGNYVLLQLRTGTHLLREQISALAEKLRPYGLIRIHRSVLVNAAYVAAMEPLFTGEYLLRMKDGVEFNVTRTYKKNLKELASFWIGTDVEPADRCRSNRCESLCILEFCRVVADIGANIRCSIATLHEQFLRRPQADLSKRPGPTGMHTATFLSIN